MPFEATRDGFLVSDDPARIDAAAVHAYLSRSYWAEGIPLEGYRARGLSKLLMEHIKAHPDLQGLRRWMLVTRDAHGLYKQFGFEPLDNPTSVMQIRDRDAYRRSRSDHL